MFIPKYAVITILSYITIVKANRKKTGGIKLNGIKYFRDKED